LLFFERNRVAGGRPCPAEFQVPARVTLRHSGKIVRQKPANVTARQSLETSVDIAALSWRRFLGPSGAIHEWDYEQTER
jgi:hypothetical protein